MRFSRALAYVAGVVLPIGETIRRWHQLGDLRMAPAWMDDWIIGLLLLYGAWRTRHDVVHGRAVLAAAWGFACGMGYFSFFSELMNLTLTDPSGFPATTVAVVKGLMLAVAVAALIATLRWKPDAR